GGGVHDAQRHPGAVVKATRLATRRPVAQEIQDACGQHGVAGSGIAHAIERLSKPPKSWIVVGAAPISTNGRSASQWAEKTTMTRGRGRLAPRPARNA